ncbi:hypothetical protein MNBD_ALPHA09-8 [hydrothermal vent metagenome]|uniref:DUF2066 domain-containing protein n=1 Tax=hydrothermal vent metagenome TaxID=652676 RepID=A0A3B0T2I0_9ZZZZ
MPGRAGKLCTSAKTGPTAKVVHWAGATVFSVFLAALALTWPQFARANIFTVSDIEISATASTANEAKQIAIAEGQSKALAALLDRLITPEDLANLPEIEPEMLQQVVIGFSLDNERTGPTQYLASLTVRFHPDAIELLLAQNGIKLSIVKSPPTLLVPVFWNANQLSVLSGVDAWTETFRRLGLQNRLVPLLQPLGDAADAAIDREAVIAADDLALGQLMARYAVEYAVVATAIYAPDKAVVSGTLTGPGPAGDVNIQKQIELVPGNEAKAFRDLANALLDALDQQWRNSEGGSAAGSEDFAFVVPFRDLPEWVGVRDRLETMVGVKSVDVAALAAGSASVVVKFDGDLRAFLYQLEGLGFAIYDTGERWELGPL